MMPSIPRKPTDLFYESACRLHPPSRAGNVNVSVTLKAKQHLETTVLRERIVYVGLVVMANVTVDGPSL